MGSTVDAIVCTTTLLKREDCKSTEHDSAFSQWKILIGPCDWEDYFSNKEGVERYRTHNLPNCSSCPGLYELGIVVPLRRTEAKSSSKLSSESILPVYLGQANKVRTRLQQYGRDGAHLPNGFTEIFSYGFAIAFRWAPMGSKKDAEKTESQILKKYDYGWNRGMNGERRPCDVLQKLKAVASSTKRIPLVFKELHVFCPKKVGLSIKRCDSPVLENGSSFYTKQEGTNILYRILKFSRSHPTFVSIECDVNYGDTGTCGVALGHGSICTRPPVEGRKRCADHKWMKVSAFVGPRLLTNTEDIRHLTCGVTLDDASLCKRVPVSGRKRCEEHKGIRKDGRIPLPLTVQEKRYIPSSGVDLEIGTFCSRRKSYEEHKGMMVDRNKSKVLNREYSNDTGAASLTCVAITNNGSSCSRIPRKDSKFCWQHGAMRAKINHSSRESDLYKNSPCSSTCGAITKRGTFCSRRTTGGQRCFQH